MSNKNKEEEGVEPEESEITTHVPENLLVSAEWEVVRQLELPPTARDMRGSKYPIHDLEVGDAVVTSTKHSKNIAVVARSYAKRNEGWKFITRSLGDDKRAIVRVA